MEAAGGGSGDEDIANRLRFQTENADATLAYVQHALTLCGDDDEARKCIGYIYALTTEGRGVNLELGELFCKRTNAIPVGAYQRMVEESKSKSSADDVPAATSLLDEKLLEENRYLKKTLRESHAWAQKAKAKIVSTEAAHKEECQALRDELERERNRNRLLLIRKAKKATNGSKGSGNANTQLTLASNKQKSRKFLDRIREKEELKQSSRFLFAYGQIPIIPGAAMLSVGHCESGHPLHKVDRYLFRAMAENQELCTFLRVVEGGEDVNYGSTYGTIAMTIDKSSKRLSDDQPSCDDESSDAAVAVEAAIEELRQQLLKTNPQLASLEKKGREEDLYDSLRSKLREYVTAKKQVKVFLSTAAKRGAMDYLHRKVRISDVLSISDLETARFLYIALSNDPTMDAFEALTVYSFRTAILRKALNSTDADTRLNGALLIISISKGIRNKSKRAVLPHWQDAGNFNPNTGVVDESTDESEGLFLDSDISIDASSTQKKAQNVATRSFFLQDLDAIVSREYQRHEIQIDSFSDILVYSSPTDIHKEFGVFETKIFYEKALKGEAQSTADVKKMRELAEKAMERKMVTNECDQFANVAGEGDLGEIFSRLLGPVINSTT